MSRKFTIPSNSIGTDPEFAVCKIDDVTSVVSVEGLLGGTKEEPLSLGNGCSRQEDNVMAEICVPPAKSKVDFVNNIKYAKEKCNEILSKYDLELTTLSSHIYDESELKSEQTCEFGCSVSFNAYTKDIRDKPDPNVIPGLRTCGFHIHVGFEVKYEDIRPDDYYEFIKYMDLYLGIPSVLVDMDDKRRALYGQAGDMRVKELITEKPDTMLCIIEYRSLGGNLLSTDELVGWVYDQTLEAIDAFNREVPLPKQDMEKIINNSMQDEAQEIVSLYGITLPAVKVIKDGLICV